MATGMKRRNRIGEFIARLLDRRRGHTAPAQLSGHGPSGMNHGMNQQLRVRWSDNSAAIVGSPRNIEAKIAAYQAHGCGQADRVVRRPEPALSSGVVANQEPRNTNAPTLSLRSPRLTWVDKCQR